MHLYDGCGRGHSYRVKACQCGEQFDSVSDLTSHLMDLKHDKRHLITLALTQ